MTEPNSPVSPPLDPAPPPQVDAYAPAPIPALSYSDYGSGGYRQRPGIITSIGVISIVVGCLSAMTSLMGGCSMLEVTMFARMSRLSSRPAAVYSAPPPPAVVSTHVIAVPRKPGDQYSVDVETSQVLPPATAPSVPTNSAALTPAEVQGAIARAQRMVNGQLNAAQVSALTTALSDPNQTIIAPGTAWSPVRMGNMDGNGGANIFFTGGFVNIDAQGRLTTNQMGLPKFQISDAALACTGVDIVLSMALAIFLFVAGVMALRQTSSSRRLHLIYALIKIPLAVGGAVAIGYLVYGFYAGIAASAPGGAALPSRGIAIVWASVVGIAAVIYPLSLLVALNTRGVKEYYRQVRG